MIAPARTSTVSGTWTVNWKGPRTNPDTTPTQIGRQCINRAENRDHQTAVTTVANQLRNGLNENKDSKFGNCKLPGYNQAKYEYIKAVLDFIKSDLNLVNPIYPQLNSIAPKKFKLETHIAQISDAIVRAVTSRNTTLPSIQPVIDRVEESKIEDVQPKSNFPTADSVPGSLGSPNLSSTGRGSITHGVDVLGFTLGRGFNGASLEVVKISDTPDKKDSTRSRSGSNSSAESKSDLDQSPKATVAV